MSKRFVILALLLVTAALLLAACGSDEPKTPTTTPLTYTTVSVQGAYQELQSNNQAIIVDVRNPDEWAATGVPPSAKLIPLPEFEQRAPNELPKDQEILVICNSGNRSRVASESLINLGYQNVINVDGGIQAWLRANLPVEAYTP